MVQKNQSEVIETEGVTPLQKVLNAWAKQPTQTAEVIQLKGFKHPETARIFGLVFGLCQLKNHGEIHYFSGGYDDWAGARGWCEIPFSDLLRGSISRRFSPHCGEWLDGYPLTLQMLEEVAE